MEQMYEVELTARQEHLGRSQPVSATYRLLATSESDAKSQAVARMEKEYKVAAGSVRTVSSRLRNIHFQNGVQRAKAEIAQRVGNSTPAYIKEVDGQFYIVSKNGKQLSTSFGTKDQAIMWGRKEGYHLLGMID